MDENQINEPNVMFDAKEFLNDDFEVDCNLNKLIQGLNSISKYESLNDEINKIIASNFIQTIVYDNLQVSIFKRLKEYISMDDENIPTAESTEWNDKSMNILKLTIHFLAIICERTPSNIEILDHLFDRIELILEVLKDDNLSEEFNRTIYEIKKGYLERQNQTRQKNHNNKPNVEPPENFRTIPIIPKLDEIKISKSLFLRSNLKYGSFNSVEHYLDVHFRLLREDYVGSLREGVMEYLDVSKIKKKNNKKQASSNDSNEYSSL